MTKQIYLETFKKCPGSLCFKLLQQYNRLQNTDASPPSFYPLYEKPLKCTALVRLAMSLSHYSISIFSCYSFAFPSIFCLYKLCIYS